MSTMVKALQVGTLSAFSVGILACAPQKNANILPVKTAEKTLSAIISLPFEAVTFANSNPAQPKQAITTSVEQNLQPVNLQQSEPKVVQPSVKFVQPNVQVEPVKQAKPVEQAQPASPVQLAQKNSSYNFYGNPDQPGYQIQVAIFSLFDQGIPLQQATQQVIDLVINQNQVIRSALAMAAVAKQPNLSVEFVLDIAELTALLDATKRAIEDNPDQLSSIISLGVTLYPDFSKEIISAATLTGEMTEEEAMLLAIAAGADPTLLASTTAAGADGPGLSAFAATPLGSGVGAGGTGGGDTTASTN